MTKEQVNKLLAMIVGAYPYLTKEWDPSYMSSLWTYLFSDLTYEEVTQALMDYLRTSTSGYPPNPAQLRDLVRRRKEPPELSEAEAWHLISRAVQRSTYYSGEEFRKLPPILQRVVGSPSNLHEWAFSDGQYFRNNLFPWFIRSYRQALETQKSSAALPEARPFRPEPSPVSFLTGFIQEPSYGIISGGKPKSGLGGNDKWILSNWIFSATNS